MEENLRKLLIFSYARYSHFPVSCVVVMKDNKIFNGVNVENSSFGATICAERVAITTAIANGYQKGDFKEIHIMNKTEEFAMPCMICRQVMDEFFDEDTKVIVYTYSGKKQEFAFKQLNPYPFGGLL